MPFWLFVGFGLGRFDLFILVIYLVFTPSPFCPLVPPFYTHLPPFSHCPHTFVPFAFILVPHCPIYPLCRDTLAVALCPLPPCLYLLRRLVGPRPRLIAGTLIYPTVGGQDLTPLPQPLAVALAPFTHLPPLPLHCSAVGLRFLVTLFTFIFDLLLFGYLVGSVWLVGLPCPLRLCRYLVRCYLLLFVAGWCGWLIWLFDLFIITTHTHTLPCPAPLFTLPLPVGSCPLWFPSWFLPVPYSSPLFIAGLPPCLCPLPVRWLVGYLLPGREQHLVPCMSCAHTCLVCISCCISLYMHATWHLPACLFFYTLACTHCLYMPCLAHTLQCYICLYPLHCLASALPLPAHHHRPLQVMQIFINHACCISCFPNLFACLPMPAALCHRTHTLPVPHTCLCLPALAFAGCVLLHGRLSLYALCHTLPVCCLPLVTWPCLCPILHCLFLVSPHTYLPLST